MSTWVKTIDDDYLNLDNNGKLGVSGVQDTVSGVITWRVHHVLPHASAHTLSGGYATKEDAQAALNEFAVGLEYSEVQPPVTDEETATEESD